MYSMLVVFFEGPDDERFLKQVAKPILCTRNNYVQFIPYAGKPKGFVDRFIDSINATQYKDYIYLTDLDVFPCVTARKHQVQQYVGNINLDKVVIARPEIEGWYLAGLETRHCTELDVQSLTNTADVTKERFRQMVPNTYRSYILFMEDILNRFSIDIAKEKNESFRYFADKYL